MANRDEVNSVLAELNKLMLEHERDHEQPPHMMLPGTVVVKLDLPSLKQKAWDLLDKSTSSYQRVIALLGCYRHACLLVYGKKSYAFTNGDPKKFKFWGAIAKAADELVGEEVAPLAWAEWVMTGLKKKRFPHKAPPITMVFSASNIKKHHNWFLSDYERPGPERVITDAHREQHWRFREAHRRNHSPHRDPYVGFPRWYTDLRTKEVKQGIHDPLENYPRIVDRDRDKKYSRES